MIISQVGPEYVDPERHINTFVLYENYTSYGRSIHTDTWSNIKNRTKSYYTFTLELVYEHP